MTMQRICRDDAALQLKKLDELQSAGRFVVSRRQHIDERHAVIALHAVTITGGM